VMRLRYIWTSCRHVTCRASRAVRISRSCLLSRQCGKQGALAWRHYETRTDNQNGCHKPKNLTLQLAPPGVASNSTLPVISGLQRLVIEPVSALHQFDADTAWRGAVIGRGAVIRSQQQITFRLGCEIHSADLTHAQIDHICTRCRQMCEVMMCYYRMEELNCQWSFFVRRADHSELPSEPGAATFLPYKHRGTALIPPDKYADSGGKGDAR